MLAHSRQYLYGNEQASQERVLPWVLPRGGMMHQLLQLPTPGTDCGFSEEQRISPSVGWESEVQVSRLGSSGASLLCAPASSLPAHKPVTGWLPDGLTQCAPSIQAPPPSRCPQGAQGSGHRGGGTFPQVPLPWTQGPGTLAQNELIMDRFCVRRSSRQAHLRFSCYESSFTPSQEADGNPTVLVLG